MPGETETKDTKKAETSAADSKGKANGTDTKVETETETKGELAEVFDDASRDEGKEKPAAKPGGDLKLAVPDDLKDLFGKADDYVTAAKEAGLTQGQLDKVGAVLFDRVKAAAQEADQEAERISLEWRRELMGDQKLGGAKLKETMLTVERGARAIGGSALAIAVAKHLKGEEVIPGPMLVRALHLVGLDHNEDRLGAGGPSPKDDDVGLSPMEREFKRVHPESHKRMQAERNANQGRR